MMNEETEPSSANGGVKFFARISQVYQSLLDQWTPHKKVRWAACILCIFVFLLRVFIMQGWYISTLIGLICTFFEVFNVPVFWPILVMYFITLFCLTMKRQIKHMIKYKYLPFTRNKPRYEKLNNVQK
uniref:Protein RER1 n=1 Tax=Megaselia scalaris TaxID=36166 RepID=T1GH35_MEGSC